MGLQLVAVEFVKDPRLIVLNVALATPVFFAVGCIGTAFALEKEEGTYDWLQASPATGGQVLVAKLSLCVFGTTAMYAVLFPAAWWLTAGLLPEAAEWNGILALWPLAAIEAIAWGTFFSLRSARPLSAIILAMVVNSTVIHLAAMPYATQEFNFGRYLSAIPLRLVVLVPVLTYGIYLGLRWLQPEVLRPIKRQTIPRDGNPRRPMRRVANVDPRAHLHVRDRGMLLGHLLWQFGRQSWRLMLLLVALQIAATFLVRNSGIDNGNQLSIIPLIGFAALMGGCVFLPDQERRGYRFFVEHNVPPRKVWLTRLVPWIIAATFSGLFVAYLWIRSTEFGEVSRLLWAVFSWDRSTADEIWHRYRAASMNRLNPTPLFFGLSAAVLSFAGGQWISMLVRSGLLAGFFTLLLSIVLTLWIVACLAMQLSWLWFVVPIPLLLFFATWLRAPDWINDNTTWKSRGSATAAVIVPMLFLCAAAPIVRVNQVPVDVRGPGFSVTYYLSQITPESLAAGAVYKRANEALQADDNDQRALDLMLDASDTTQAIVTNPETLVDWPVVNGDWLISVVYRSADALTASGELDQALDRYFMAFQVKSDLTNYAPNFESWKHYRYEPIAVTLNGVNEWAAHESQSQELLRAAIARLEKISVEILHTEDAIKSNYILCQRYIEGDDRLATMLIGENSQLVFQRSLLARFAPWEAHREMRALNLKAGFWINRMNALSLRLEDDKDGNAPPEDPFYSRDSHQYAIGAHALTVPFDRWSIRLYERTVAFEASRRASLIILACQAYRHQHGTLPHTLADLVGHPAGGEAYLAALPTDPYTGRTYVYFRDGLPKPPSPADQDEFDSWKRNYQSEQPHGTIQFGEPCLWSPGSSVHTETSENPYGFRYYQFNGSLKQPDYEAWARGQWFPIPLKFPADEPVVEPEPEKNGDEKPSDATQDAATEVDDLFRNSDTIEPGTPQP